MKPCLSALGYDPVTGPQPTVLVTGATGFVGQHLIALLLERGYPVVAHSIPGDPLAHTLPDAVRYVACDVTDAEAVRSLVAEAAPAAIFHLAGLVRGRDLQRLLAVNVMGTDAVLKAASQCQTQPTVVIPGSAAEYGVLAGDVPVTEMAPLRPNSAYGVSKIAQTMTGLSYARRGDVPVVVGRIFNITGPAEPKVMLCGAVAGQIAAIEAGDVPPVLQIGNLSPYRDYVDIRDAVRALWLLWQKGQSGEVYNICSGEPRQVQSVVDALIAQARVPLTVQPDPARQRPSDIPFCAGNPSKLAEATGWTPERSLEATLRDTLDWWREHHRSGGV